jgi:transcriptional regulator with XRE-family HTH domain
MGTGPYSRIVTGQVGWHLDSVIQPGLKKSGLVTSKPTTARIDDPAAVGSRLRLLRKAFGAVQQYSREMSQSEMARRSGMTVQSWHNAESGYNRIGLDSALQVVALTGATLDWIYRGVRSGLPRALDLEIEKLEKEPVKRRA